MQGGFSAWVERVGPRYYSIRSKTTSTKAGALSPTMEYDPRSRLDSWRTSFLLALLYNKKAAPPGQLQAE